MRDIKTITFALITCLSCSLVLAVAYSVLDPLYKANKKNELRALVLRACGEDSKKYSKDELKKQFD